MGKIVTKRIKLWDSGMENDVRSPRVGATRLLKNFDIATFPYRLQPYRSSESGNSDTTRQLKNFVFIDGKAWGLGFDGSNKTQIYRKSTFTDGTWDTTAASTGNKTPSDYSLFLPYSYGGETYIYGSQGTGGASIELFKYNIDGSGWTNNEGSGSIFSANPLSIGQGLVHSKDDNLYVPYLDSAGAPQIARNNAGTWTDTVCPGLPIGYNITSLFEEGNLLGIALNRRSAQGRDTSKVLLWNRDASVTELTDSVDFGAGDLELVEEIDGEMVGVVVLGNRLQVKVPLTYGAKPVLEFVCDSAPSIIDFRKQKINNRLLFLGSLAIDGTTHYGVWAVWKNQRGEWCLALDRTPNNDTDPSSLISFIQFNSSNVDYMLIAYNDGSNDQVSKTDNTALYTATSVVETLKETDNIDIEKKLTGATVNFPYLPDNGSVVLKYKKEGETSFTTIFTHTTASTVSHSAINIESSGATLPVFREIQFRIEYKVSSGTVSPERDLGIAELEFTYEMIGKKPYASV